MDDNLPDHVRDYKLQTKFSKGSHIHTLNDPDAPPSSQSRLERWKYEKLLGHGGQGEVFLQTCIEGSRRYTKRAVKKIALHQKSGGRRRYLRELDTIIKFSHEKYSKHFVKSLGWYESKNSLYIAMEYFPAGDLHTYLAQCPPLPEDDTCQITSQVVCGLAAMHGEGIAHRDIKPQNILIYQSPTPTELGSWWVKLSDFGISKRLETDGSSSTAIGTLDYMAPELLGRHGLAEIDYRAADMWALGVMIFGILTKTRLFQSLQDSFEYVTSPDRLFPRRLLDDRQIRDEGHAFIRALLRPKPDERLDSNTAIRHAWVKAWMPSAPIILDDLSESSATFSRRGSVDQETGITTDVSDITGLYCLIGSGTQSSLTVNPKAASTEVSGSHISSSRAEESPISQDRCRATRDLFFAADRGDVDRAKFLLENGDSVKTMNKHGWELVYKAASNGQVEVVKLLLEKGADPMAAGPEGHTPLTMASGRGNLEVAELLLEKGADPTAADPKGWTPLTIASDRGNLEVAKLLLEGGADPIAADPEGWTLSIASDRGNLEVAKLLLEKGADPMAAVGGWTPLTLASQEGHLEVAKLLLEKGADPTAVDPKGWTPLTKASDRGSLEVAKLLLEKGADPMAAVGGWTPLTLASQEGHLEVVKLLLEKGADPTAADPNRYTPLIIASDRGNLEIAKLLLEKGADPMAAVDGWTPLTLASYRGSLEIVKLLLEKGADLTVGNCRGKTPLSLASQESHFEVVKLLREKGAIK